MFTYTCPVEMCPQSKGQIYGSYLQECFGQASQVIPECWGSPSPMFQQCFSIASAILHHRSGFTNDSTMRHQLFTTVSSMLTNASAASAILQQFFRNASACFIKVIHFLLWKLFGCKQSLSSSLLAQLFGGSYAAPTKY